MHKYRECVRNFWESLTERLVDVTVPRDDYRATESLTARAQQLTPLPDSNFNIFILSLYFSRIALYLCIDVGTLQTEP